MKTSHKFKSEDIEIDSDSSMQEFEARGVIGKRIVKIEAKEHELTLGFEDGSKLEVHGHRYEDASLGIDYFGA